MVAEQKIACRTFQTAMLADGDMGKSENSYGDTLLQKTKDTATFSLDFFLIPSTKHLSFKHMLLSRLHGLFHLSKNFSFPLRRHIPQRENRDGKLDKALRIVEEK